MSTRITYISLGLTILFFCILIIVLYSIRFSEVEESRFSVDYYYEEKEEETQEAVDEQPEETSNLETHQAYNEAEKNISNIEQNSNSPSEFEKQLQAMEQALASSRESIPIPQEIDAETYPQTSKVIHNENRIRNSSVRYFLEKRKAVYLPNPVYTCPNTGTIVVNIHVDKLGKVINTTVDNSKSTTTDKCLEEQALEYAKQTIFDISESSEKNKRVVLPIFL